jgi:UDPglucose--hexose-1-phosphate uridylyltransferase
MPLPIAAAISLHCILAAAALFRAQSLPEERMPELRRDPLLNRWVIIAEERQRRPVHPDDRPEQFTPLEAEQDPFAAGNEGYTTPEVYAVRPDGGPSNGPGWTVRVVPNKFPALRVEGELDPRGNGIYDLLNGIGAHEVVVETPDPNMHMKDLPLDHLTAVVGAYRLRVEDLSRDKRFAYVLVFKNHGREAGATQPHSHSQIVATPIVPSRIHTQLTALHGHWKLKRRSLFADILEQELRQRERIVFENEHMLAFCPFASAFPFEVQIFPKRQCADFRQATQAELAGLAAALKACLQKWERVLGPIPFNFVIYTAPNDTDVTGIREEFPMLDVYYQWHLEMFPRINRTAGFEWGTGYYINTVAPENAAAALRDVEVELG